MKILSKAETVMVAKYKGLEQARVVLDELRRSGVPQAELALITDGDFYPETDFKVLDGALLEEPEGVVEDATEAGAIAGGAGGALLGLGAVALPGMGPVLVLGSILLGAMTGMSAGALAGGAVGIMLELGYSKEQAESLSSGLDEGQVLVLVEDKTLSEARISEILRAHAPGLVISKGIA